MYKVVAGIDVPDMRALNQPVVLDDACAFKAVLQRLDAVVDVPFAVVAGLEDDGELKRFREWRFIEPFNGRQSSSILLPEPDVRFSADAPGSA